MISYQAILAVLEARFDYYSARVVLAEALRKAGLRVDCSVFTPLEVRNIADALAVVGLRVEKVVEGLRALASEAEKINAAAGQEAVLEVTPEKGDLASQGTEDEGAQVVPDVGSKEPPLIVEEEGQKKKKKR